MCGILKDSLLGVIILTKFVDPDSYSCYGYGITFDSGSPCTILNSYGENIIVFEVENNSPVDTNNKNKHLVLYEGAKQRLNNTSITAESKYSINFSSLG